MSLHTWASWVNRLANTASFTDRVSGCATLQCPRVLLGQGNGGSSRRDKRMVRQSIRVVRSVSCHFLNPADTVYLSAGFLPTAMCSTVRTTPDLMARSPRARARPPPSLPCRTALGLQSHSASTFRASLIAGRPRVSLTLEASQMT